MSRKFASDLEQFQQLNPNYMDSLTSIAASKDDPKIFVKTMIVEYTKEQLENQVSSMEFDIKQAETNIADWQKRIDEIRMLVPKEEPKLSEGL